MLATQHIVDGGYIDADIAPVTENTDTSRVLGWFLADSGNPFSLDSHSWRHPLDAVGDKRTKLAAKRKATSMLR